MAERKRDYNLFPPIVDSYMPSFAIEDKECQILFSISDYNSLNAIKGAEVSINFYLTAVKRKPKVQKKDIEPLGTIPPNNRKP